MDGGSPHRHVGYFATKGSQSAYSVSRRLTASQTDSGFRAEGVERIQRVQYSPNVRGDIRSVRATSDHVADGLSSHNRRPRRRTAVTITSLRRPLVGLPTRIRQSSSSFRGEQPVARARACTLLTTGTSGLNVSDKPRRSWISPRSRG
jgi:hypothetical protein